MKQTSKIENIYNEIEHLSVKERDRLYNRIKKSFYQNKEIVAYTTNGEPLTIEQYQKRVHAAIEQCIKGESVTLEDLSEELGYIYADL
jgi:hypothetical protein